MGSAPAKAFDFKKTFFAQIFKNLINNKIIYIMKIVRVVCVILEPKNGIFLRNMAENIENKASTFQLQLMQHVNL